MAKRKPATTSKPVLTGPKSEQLKTLLAPSTGKTIADLSARLGWQRHTTRAAITRLKQAGTGVIKMDAAEGSRQSRYRLAEEQE